mgnify:CR=1 FL=1
MAPSIARLPVTSKVLYGRDDDLTGPDREVDVLQHVQLTEVLVDALEDDEGLGQAVNLAIGTRPRSDACTRDGRVTESRSSGPPDLPYPLGDGPNGRQMAGRLSGGCHA